MVKEISQDIISPLLEAGYERRNLEFKPPFNWNDTEQVWLRENVAKAIIGLSNMPGGGWLIIGINDSDGSNPPEIVGMNAEEIASFENYDAIKGFVDGYSYLPTDFDLRIDPERKLIVVEVREFSNYPLITRRNSESNGLMIRDCIYVRALRGQPATIKATHLEMQEVVDLAVDKQSRKLRKRGYRPSGQMQGEAYFADELNDIKE